MWASTVGSAPLPLPISTRLQQHGASSRSAAGISPSGFCWVIEGQELLLWRRGDTVRVLSLRLPPGPPQQRHYVTVLSHASSSTTTVVTCSESGLLTYWLDANHTSEPLHHQVILAASASMHPGQPQAAVTAFTAEIPELAASAGPSFVGVMGSVDGHLFFIQGSPQVRPGVD